MVIVMIVMMLMTMDVIPAPGVWMLTKTAVNLLSATMVGLRAADRPALLIVTSIYHQHLTVQS